MLYEVITPDAGQRYVPGVDALFESAGKMFGKNLLAVVLTGMGVITSYSIHYTKLYET